MKKSSLLKMKNLPTTEEMLAVAREDVPVKVGSGWNTSYRCRYSGFARSSVEGGILKVTLYDPDAMRLGGTLPVYEIFMEKEKQQFLTYDRAHDKWRTAKIDYLEWQAKESNNVWISAVDDAQIRQYLASDEKSVYRAILKFQRAVRDAELERRHRKETDPWDAELSQTPPLPKDWERWVNKVGIQENYIFYDYHRGGAKHGYCTYCEKEVALKQRPYLSMADKLGINTNDEIVYRVKLLRQRHDELVEQLRKRERDMEAAATARKYRKIAGICRLIKPKYEYTGEVYSIVIPSGVRDIMREGDALSHCVGKSDRYWERIEQQEAYILFLRKTAEIDKPYYTLEVEPNGTIRQKRTYFDRQNDDLKDAEQFLKEWQKVVSERLTESDREKAEKSKVLRLQEFEQLRQDDIRIHTGDLAGQRLVDVLVSDLMETAA